MATPTLADQTAEGRPGTALPAELESSARPSSGDPTPRGGALWIEHGWWGIAMFAGGLVGGAGALGDNSFLTHLATGRLIRADRVPHVDPYTFTAGGQPWTVQSWLASWWYATLEAVGGAAAIRLWISLVTGVLVALLWRLSRPAGGLVGRVLLVGLATVVGFSWWSERPQVMAFVLLAVTAVVLAEHRPPWLLAPVLALWINLHGSFPLGLVLAVVWVGRNAIVRRRLRMCDLGAPVWASVGAVIGATASPYGLDLLVFPVHMLSRSANLKFIEEWRPPRLGEQFTMLFALQSLGVMAALVRRRWWASVVAVGIFIALAATSARNLPVASIVMIPLAAPAFAGLGTLAVGAARPRRHIAIGAMIALMATGLVVAATPSYDMRPYPVAAIDWMADRGLIARPGVRVITHDYVGNYLEWRFGSDANVWIDDRAELLPTQAINDYVTLLSHDEPAAGVLRRTGADFVVWDIDERLAGSLETMAGWRVVYRDDAAVVACRVRDRGRCGADI